MNSVDCSFQRKKKAIGRGDANVLFRIKFPSRQSILGRRVYVLLRIIVLITGFHYVWLEGLLHNASSPAAGEFECTDTRDPNLGGVTCMTNV
jgi:hypothetical protein